MTSSAPAQPDRLLKLADVIGSRKHGVQGLVPMSKSKWYQGVSRCKFPAPIHIGSSSYWRESDITRLINDAIRGQ